MTTVAVTGHRDRTADPQALADVLARWQGGRLVHGGARGFDRQAESAAIALGYSITAIIPDWDRFGRSAAMRRNAEIIADADVLIACWDGREHGGTYATIGMARRRGIPIVYLTPAG